MFILLFSLTLCILSIGVWVHGWEAHGMLWMRIKNCGAQQRKNTASQQSLLSLASAACLAQPIRRTLWSIGCDEFSGPNRPSPIFTIDGWYEPSRKWYAYGILGFPHESSSSRKGPYCNQQNDWRMPRSSTIRANECFTPYVQGLLRG